MDKQNFIQKHQNWAFLQDYVKHCMEIHLNESLSILFEAWIHLRKPKQKEWLWDIKITDYAVYMVMNQYPLNQFAFCKICWPKLSSCQLMLEENCASKKRTKK